MNRMLKKCLVGFLAASSALVGLIPLPAAAHGERATEPYIRTRTVHWYDVTWSTDKIGVNETVTVAGKFHLFKDWPEAATLPELSFLSNATPGGVMTRWESYVNGIPAQQSIRGLEIGRDYEFRLVMKGRIPGRWHLHPVLNVHGAGPIVGPGEWIDVSGNAADFKQSVTTITGVDIEDLQHFGVSRARWWQLGYGALAAIWLLWWLRRPLIIPRWLAAQKGRDDLLLTPSDDKFAAATIVVVLLVVIIGYTQTVKEFPYIVPLQSGFVKVPPLPKVPEVVNLEVKKAVYDVPGRSMRFDVLVTNNAERSVRVGEFMTAQLRFINKDLPAAVAGIDPKFPKDLVAKTGLKLSSDAPIAPGETRELRIEATDAAWEIERLVSFLSNVDSRVGGMVFSFDEKGNRYMSEISGAIVPVFTELGGVKTAAAH